MKRAMFPKICGIILICCMLLTIILSVGSCKRKGEDSSNNSSSNNNSSVVQNSSSPNTDNDVSSNPTPVDLGYEDNSDDDYADWPEEEDDSDAPYIPGTPPPDIEDENDYDNTEDGWGGNILEDFESYDGDSELLRTYFRPVTHDTSYNPNPVITLDTDNPHSGKYCGRFDVPTQDPTAAKQWYSGFSVNLAKPVKVTKNDQISLWVRVAETTGITSYILSAGGPSGSMAHPAGSTFKNTGDWQKIILPRIEIRGEYIAITTIRIFMELKSKPFSIWIDDIMVEPAPYRETFESTGIQKGQEIPDYEKAPGSDPITIKIDSANPHAGENSGRIEYNSGGDAGYSSLIVPFDQPQDWQSDVKYMSLWLRSDGPPQTVFPGFFANGKQFEYNHGIISGFGWNQYVFDLSEFKYLGIHAPTEEDLKKVDAFFISFIGGDGDRTVWIDNIEFLVEAPLNAGAPKKPDNEQPVEIENFEGYPEGLPADYATWSNNPGIGYYPASVELSQDSPRSGENHALFRAYNQTGAVNQYTTRIHEMTVTLSESVPFTAGQQVSIWLKKHNWGVTASGEYIDLRIYTDTGHVNARFDTLTDDWERRTVPLGATAGNITGYRLTVRITASTNPDTGVSYPRFYFDDITLEPSLVLKNATLIEDFEYYPLRSGTEIATYQPVADTGYSEGAKLTLDSAIYRSQYCSGKLNIPAGTANKYGFETVLEPSVTFKSVDTLTLWLKTAGARDYQVDVYTTGGEITTGKQTAAGSSEWTKITMPFGSLSETSVQITRFRITVWGAASAGTLWFDDFTVTKPADVIENFEYYDGNNQKIQLEYKPVINPAYSVDGNIEIDSSIKRSGDYSGKLICGSAGTGLWQGGVGIKLREPIEIDNTKQISYWVRSTPLWGEIFDHRYNVRVLTTKGVMSLGIKALPADGEWHQIILPCELPEPALITGIELITDNYGYGGRPLWFDDFTIESKP